MIDSTIDFQKVEGATCVLERLKDSEYMTIKNVVRPCFRILELEQATNKLKRSVKHYFWILFILIVDFMYICKQADFKNHF